MSQNKLKEKDITWKLLHSWHIALTFFMGLLSWLTFLYMYLKGKKRSWLIAAIIYGAALGILIYYTNKYPDEKTRPDFVNQIVYGYLILWLISIVHAFISLKEFWLRTITYEEVQEEKIQSLETNIRKEMGIINNPIEEVLTEFKENDNTVKITKFILDNLPMAPEFYYYMDFPRAIKRYQTNVSPELIDKIREIARYDDDLHKIIKTAKAIDKADGGLGIFTGLKNTYDAIKKTEGKRTFEADPQQAIDAGLKAIALAYIISLVSKENSLQTFFDLKAGQELLYYFITIELALPFTDNLIEEGGKFLYKILKQKESDIENRFANFTDEESYQKAKNILNHISDQLDRIAVVVSQNIKPFEEQLKNKLPTILNVTDSVTGGLATFLDLMPIWKFLGARVAAEAAIYKAIKN
ncbi:MAG: hypothetical protein KatS3mg129_0372 [Leptospiraceae bacterium]|nr:MAG: hypothetical protein KatS3mg129_0372 [Leptospiraceae bacterium]